MRRNQENLKVCKLWDSAEHQESESEQDGHGQNIKIVN
jgi:hypothetical protein